MKLTVLCYFLTAATIGSAQPATYPKCDGASAYTILEGVLTATGFCHSLLYSTKNRTSTCTSTTTVKECCETVTDTARVDVTVTRHHTYSTTLPTLTEYIYSSTVLIPNGPRRSVDKREAAVATPAGASSVATPTALSSCGPQAISNGCSSLLPPRTTTSTVTQTIEEKCTTTVVTTSTDRHTTTSTYTFSIYPPPDLIFSTQAVLTTTVPAACAGPRYDSGGYVGDGNGVFPQSYPIQAQTGVECCIACWHTRNCIASAFIASALDCQFLMRMNGTLPGVSDRCPFGIYDYPFGPPAKRSNIFPGPCGK